MRGEEQHSLLSSRLSQSLCSFTERSNRPITMTMAIQLHYNYSGDTTTTTTTIQYNTIMRHRDHHSSLSSTRIVVSFEGSRRHYHPGDTIIVNHRKHIKREREREYQDILNLLAHVLVTRQVSTRSRLVTESERHLSDRFEVVNADPYGRVRVSKRESAIAALGQPLEW